MVRVKSFDLCEPVSSAIRQSGSKKEVMAYETIRHGAS
jgi:hypothetical protein